MPFQISPILIFIIIIWVLPWKAWALWRAARLGQKVWFVVLLVLNTMGILEIIYLFVISKKHLKGFQSDQSQKDEIKNF
jgi:methionyl-tRNA synthetase